MMALGFTGECSSAEEVIICRPTDSGNSGSNHDGSSKASAAAKQWQRCGRLDPNHTRALGVGCMQQGFQGFSADMRMLGGCVWPSYKQAASPRMPAGYVCTY